MPTKIGVGGFFVYHQDCNPAIPSPFGYATTDGSLRLDSCGRQVHTEPGSIDRLAARRQAKRVHSRQECRFCDISALDCPERVDANTQNDAGTTSNF